VVAVAVVEGSAVAVVRGSAEASASRRILHARGKRRRVRYFTFIVSLHC